MPHLFLVAAGFSLVAAANYAVPVVVEDLSFNTWVGLTVLLARVASLLAVAGLSARILDRSPRLGTASRVVVGLAVVATLGLLTSAVLQNLGTESSLQPVLGLGTVGLSLLTYLLFGAAVLHTGAHARLVGIMLLGACVALLFGLFGPALVPIGVVGTVAELGLVATHVAIGFRLLTDTAASKRTDAPPETVAD